MRDDVILLTPRWSSDILADPRNIEELLFEFEAVGADWLLTLPVEGQIYSLPVREGEPEGTIVDIGPGIKGWATLDCYGLSKLGPGVWRVTPSLYVPDELHAYLVLCDVPEPAPFSRPLLFSATGERLRKAAQ